ncbi:Cocaine esterase [Branchiostoma belcheri]|nr:Cocaine esterase [Branchiostoma belcheri]
MAAPIVSTANGKVRGTVQYTNDLPDKPVYTFLGIPYAAPPVGDLRFRAPQPAVPWEGVRDAIELGPYCPQGTAFLNNLPVKLQHYNMDEDCLTLNVETPAIAKDAGLPVLLWIHGGGLYVGAGYFLPYTSLAAHQDVVVVTFNYRLGVLGFFSTGDGNAPGNFGFLDQVQAMVWVQENIRNFGGDPDRVTIFGESAGGASVCYHVVSPLSKGLFQRAISQSGVCQTCDTFSRPQERAVMLAQELGCDTRDTANMVAGLRQKSADELNSGTLEVMKKIVRQGAQLPFAPAVDGHFLPAEPAVIFDMGRANAADYLLGVNNHEYGLLLPMTMFPGYGRGMTEDKYLLRMKRRIGALYPGSNHDNIVAEIRRLYRDCYSGDDPMSIQHQFSQACGDNAFLAPTVFVANKHSASGQKVYLYENHYVPSRFGAGRPDWVGCDHGDELFVMSGVAFLNVPLTSGRFLRFSANDKKASLDMMAYWANFARTGSPSDGTGGPADSPTVPEWPQYTPDNPAYMKLDVTSSADVGFHPDRMALWNDVIPKLAAASGRDEL